MQWIVVKISVNRTKHIAPFLPSPFPVKHGDIGQYRVRLMNQPSKDYYSLLGVSPSSPQEHLKATYRKLLLSVHPDKQLNDSKDGQNKSAQISVQDLVDIWKVLGDPIERRKYDMYIFSKYFTIYLSKKLKLRRKKARKNQCLVDIQEIGH